MINCRNTASTSVSNQKRHSNDNSLLLHRIHTLTIRLTLTTIFFSLLSVLPDRSTFLQLPYVLLCFKKITLHDHFTSHALSLSLCSLLRYIVNSHSKWLFKWILYYDVPHLELSKLFDSFSSTTRIRQFQFRLYVCKEKKE